MKCGRDIKTKLTNVKEPNAIYILSPKFTGESTPISRRSEPT